MNPKAMMSHLWSVLWMLLEVIMLAPRAIVVSGTNIDYIFTPCGLVSEGISEKSKQTSSDRLHLTNLPCLKVIPPMMYSPILACCVRLSATKVVWPHRLICSSKCFWWRFTRVHWCLSRQNSHTSPRISLLSPIPPTYTILLPILSAVW